MYAYGIKAQLLCNTFTHKIKGIQRVTYLMLPRFESYIMMQLLHYEIFVAASTFIIKDEILIVRFT